MARTVRTREAGSRRGRAPAKGAAPARKGRAAGSGTPRKAAPSRLERELASARSRIAELERERELIAERIEIAIKSIHKVLKSHH